MSDENTCEAVGCSEPATTVRAGRNFCGRHDDGAHQQEVPIVPCAIDGCGCAATSTVNGRAYCYHHAPWAKARAAA